MSTQDNKLPTLVTGQANWDSDLDAALAIIEQGYHVTEHAGVAISTGQVLWMNSGGFFFPFDPNSLTIDPIAMAYTAAASGDSLTALAWGIVRSLGVASLGVPGFHLYVSALTPGTLVQSSGIRDRPVGLGLANGGVLFNPSLTKRRLAAMWDVDSTAIGSGTVPMWSNASSKFTMQTVAGGGGGGSYGGVAVQVNSYTGSNTITVTANASKDILVWIWNNANGNTHNIIFPNSPWDGQRLYTHNAVEFTTATPGFPHNGTFIYTTVDSTIRLLGGVASESAATPQREWVFSQAVSGWYSVK